MEKRARIAAWQRIARYIRWGRVGGGGLTRSAIPRGIASLPRKRESNRWIFISIRGAIYHSRSSGGLWRGVGGWQTGCVRSCSHTHTHTHTPHAICARSPRKNRAFASSNSPRTLSTKACRDFRSGNDQAFSSTFVTARVTFARLQERPVHPARPSGTDVSLFPFEFARTTLSYSTIALHNLFSTRGRADWPRIKRPRNQWG